MKGLIFDIEEFAVYDGPGIRTVVFFKGCPLRCEWCHNPEGLEFFPEVVVARDSCTRCGRCAEVCGHPSSCNACGTCVTACPRNIRRVCGKWLQADDLARNVLRNKQILRGSGGGITLSGGEPLAQGDFLLDFIGSLAGDLHIAVETSAYVDSKIFDEVIRRCNLVLFDIKHADPVIHKQFTGVENGLIIENLRRLIRSGRPFRARIPLIPGVNDNRENMGNTVAMLRDAPGLERVELLSFNRMAASKYGAVGKLFNPSFDPNADVAIITEPFSDLGVECVIV